MMYGAHRSRLAAVACAVLAALVLAACGGSGSSDNTAGAPTLTVPATGSATPAGGEEHEQHQLRYDLHAELVLDRRDS